MNVYLMFSDRNFDLNRQPPFNEESLMQDLELELLFQEMSLGDSFLYGIVRKALVCSLKDPERIRYRQQVLQDCLKHASVVHRLYDIAVSAIEQEKKHYFGIFMRYPVSILHSSLELMGDLVGHLKQVRKIADDESGDFSSEGFRRFFAMIRQELEDGYFDEIEDHLKAMRFPDGVLIRAGLGQGNKGRDYVLLQHRPKRTPWLQRIFSEKRSVFRFTIAPRDENGAKALSELRDRGINRAANALAQATEHILHFFKALRVELGFYIACMNLWDNWNGKRWPLTFPDPQPLGRCSHSILGLVDICLAFRMKLLPTGNDIQADDMMLVIVTGANQGGKSTFLRSIGQAQLMMQCGMFVAALSFRANVCDGLYTHFKREEDPDMTSGKLDEELRRMDEIVARIRPNAMVLLNESFAATNEREGSEIARQITQALTESRIKVFYVTHLYAYAHDMFHRKSPGTLFLRAEREADGHRTFRILPGEPLETSHGKDLYQAIFGSTMEASGGDADMSGASP